MEYSEGTRDELVIKDESEAREELDETKSEIKVQYNAVYNTKS